MAQGNKGDSEEKNTDSRVEMRNKARALAAERKASRRRAGVILADAIDRYKLDVKQIAKDTRIDIVTLRNLRVFTPHLQTIETLSKYLEAHARQVRKDEVRLSEQRVIDAAEEIRRVGRRKQIAEDLKLKFKKGGQDLAGGVVELGGSVSESSGSDDTDGEP